MVTTPNTSSSTSSRYTRRVIARQTSTTDSQESKEAETEPGQSGGTSSLSTGSLESYYLIVDPQYNNEEPITTPPPIADPPSDASYDDSFIEMVKQIVQRARIAYARSQTAEGNDNDEADSISNYLNSQASILLSSQGSNQSNNDDDDVDDDEARVEQARRAVDPQHNGAPLPYYLKEEEESSQKLIDSQASLPEFAVVKKNPCTVSGIEYVTNKKPENEQTEKEARAAAESRLYFGRERDLYKDAIKELTRWQQEEEEEGSSKDYSSWLCFDNENEVAQFKDIIYNENSDGKDQIAAEEDFIPNIHSNDDAINPLSPSMYPISQPSSPQRSPSRRYSFSPQRSLSRRNSSPLQHSPTRRDSSPLHQIEQGLALIISPHRDQLKQKQIQSIHESDSSSLGSFRDKIVMQSTPVHQRQCVPILSAANTRPILQMSSSSSKNKNTSEKKRAENVDSLFGSNQEVEERRAALFDRVKEPQPSPPRQPFFNLRK